MRLDIIFETSDLRVVGTPQVHAPSSWAVCLLMFNTNSISFDEEDYIYIPLSTGQSFYAVLCMSDFYWCKPANQVIAERFSSVTSVLAILVDQQIKVIYRF